MYVHTITSYVVLPFLIFIGETITEKTIVQSSRCFGESNSFFPKKNILILLLQQAMREAMPTKKYHYIHLLWQSGW